MYPAGTGDVNSVRVEGEAEPVSTTTAILIPTLGRHDRVCRLLENIEATSGPDLEVYFIVESEDTGTIEAVAASHAHLIYNHGPPTYASCINTAYRETVEPFLFLGADDIVFTDGWLERASARFSDPGVGIVGTEDPMLPHPDHSTHSLVRREYIGESSGCLDLPDTVLYPYWHGYTDYELVGVAKSRQAYVYSADSQVEHHHPGWDSLGRVRGGTELDNTYRKGNRNHWSDTVRFIERSTGWINRICEPSPADLDLQRFIHRNRGKLGWLRYRTRSLTELMSEKLRLSRRRSRSLADSHEEKTGP